MKQTPPPKPIEVALTAVGGTSALAHLMGIDRRIVHNWRSRKHIPAERVLAVEAASGVPRTVLRPDLYPAIPKAAQPSAQQ